MYHGDCITQGILFCKLGTTQYVLCEKRLLFMVFMVLQTIYDTGFILLQGMHNTRCNVLFNRCDKGCFFRYANGFINAEVGIKLC